MKKVILGALLIASFFAVAVQSAMAETVQRTGFIEVCKHSTATDPVTGPFTFTVAGRTVTAPTGGCSADIQVPAGPTIVREASNAYTQVTAIDTIPQGALVSSNLSTRTAVVNVPAGDISTAVTVDYTNQEVFGHLEICKAQALGAGLSGSYTFKVTGPMGFSQTQTVPVGACSDTLRVPAGIDEVDEVGTNNTDVVGISTLPVNALVTKNLAAGTSSVAIAPGNDLPNETIETFVNDSSRLKICKISGARILDGTVYSFTANGATVQAVAEPAPGSCVLVPTPFEGGTRIDIQEGITPGTAVSAISVSDNRDIAGTTNLTNRSVSVRLGSGQTVVSYTNIQEAPDLLKICKNAGQGVTVGQQITYHIGLQSLQVPAGFCEIAGAFPFNSTQTVVETPTAGLSVIGIATDPSTNLVSSNLATGTMQTLIGAPPGEVNEVTFTNATAATPPIVTPTGTPTPAASSTPVTGTGTGATQSAPTTVPTTTPPVAVTPGPVVEPVRPPAPTSHPTTHRAPKCVVIAKLVQTRGGPTLVLRIRGNAAVCHVLINELNAHGIVVARVHRTLHHGHDTRINLAHKARRVRTSLMA